MRDHFIPDAVLLTHKEIIQKANDINIETELSSFSTKIYSR